MSVYDEIDESGEIQENMNRAWADPDFKLFIWGLYFGVLIGVFYAGLHYIFNFFIYIWG